MLDHICFHQCSGSVSLENPEHTFPSSTSSVLFMYLSLLMSTLSFGPQHTGLKRIIPGSLVWFFLVVHPCHDRKRNRKHVVARAVGEHLRPSIFCECPHAFGGATLNVVFNFLVDLGNVTQPAILHSGRVTVPWRSASVL